MTFGDLKITREFLNALDDAGFTTPTPIQQKAIPPIRAGQDVIGIAQTGTGKTAAYILPILQSIKFAEGTAPKCLILVPTKELSVQVDKQLAALVTYTDIRHITLYGGIGPKHQIEKITAGCDVLISTPGRFLDLYQRGAIVTKKLKFMVLDEADRMMDMGFMPQIRRILEVIPRKRQNLLFSATFPPKVEHLADEFLLWPTRVEVTPQGTPVETIEHFLYAVPNFKTKMNLLIHLLENPEFSRVIVFVGTKERAESIAKFLKRNTAGAVASVHANKGQNSRINALESFKEGAIRILVSTDVSSRGIDVDDVSHVINFSVPHQHEDYVHRIGRTGRVFKAGTAITFVDRSETYHITKIEGIIRQEIPTKVLPKEVVVEDTPKGEFIEQAREIDYQKRKEDPTFKGAFHEKKHQPNFNKPKTHNPRRGGKRKKKH